MKGFKMTPVEKIKELLKQGKIVSFTTYTCITRLSKKHIDQIKSGKNNEILIQHGKKWIDSSFTKITYK